MRSDPAWHHASPWHYVNIGDDETYETAQKNPEGDVVEAIQRLTGVLRDSQATPQDKVVAVKFLVHFVGDIHQPLHVGRHDDQGGNTIQVQWFGAPSNLHKVWDEQLIEAQKLSFSEFAASHSIGFSGGQLPSYVEGSSALDFPLIHDAQSQDPS